MPFEIDRSYAAPSFTIIPDDAQLAAYIAWLQKELAVARAERDARCPRTAPKTKSAAQELASRGGKATAAKMTPDERRERASKAALARWANRRAKPVAL